MRNLFLFKKIILLTLALIIFYLVDFSKINYKYVNKNFIEFDYKNLDSEINKKIYLFFEKKISQIFF